ncbi:hypothetical protein B0H13DRAFT_1866067 [Mycena leptocephala]|nr:hypothetical protein B0H13DRAFT_1866067 [Mycena leptocephala]
MSSVRGTTSGSITTWNLNQGDMYGVGTWTLKVAAELYKCTREQGNKSKGSWFYVEPDKEWKPGQCPSAATSGTTAKALVQEGSQGNWQIEFSTKEAAAEEKALDSHIDRLGWRDEGWGGKAWEARSTEVGMVHVKCTVKSGRWKCELGRTCDARSTECKCRRKIKVECRPVSSICRRSAHAGGHRSHGLSEARCSGLARNTRARCEVEGAIVPTTPKVSIWQSVSGRVMHGQGGGARAKARVHMRQLERAMCSGAGVGRGSASASAGRWETASGPFAIENRELAGE